MHTAQTMQRAALAVVAVVAVALTTSCLQGNRRAVLVSAANKADADAAAAERYARKILSAHQARSDTSSARTLDTIVRDVKSISARVGAARADSRKRVATKHSKHRKSNLKAAESPIDKQRAQIRSLESRLTTAEKEAITADGDAAAAESSARKLLPGHQVSRIATGVSKHGGAHSKLYHVMDAPGAHNVANHRDAVQYDYRHHDAAWDGNRIPTEGRGDRKDRQARNSRYPDYDAPSSPGGYNFVYGKDETYAPQDYGSYYGPQAYYDGYYRGGDGSTERATRNGAGRTGRGRQGRGRHVYAYASPYDRSEEFRQHENYVNMIYHWYTTVTNENQQQTISDAQKWQYNAALQAYDAYLRDEQADRD